MVKAAFVPFSAIVGNPANAGAARLCGVSPCPVPDTATALPNQARYQLRYTRIFNFCHDTTARGKNKDFSVCGHSCGQNRFCAVFGDQRKTSKRRRCKALRRFASPYPGYNHGTPKCRALPVEPHPDIHFSAMIPRRGVKIKFFLSVVIPVVKAAFVPFSATGGKPAIARAARLCGLLSKPRMDRVYALPNQARYQLRYTRIKICRPHPGGISTIPAFFLACKGKIYLGAFWADCNM